MPTEKKADNTKAVYYDSFEVDFSDISRPENEKRHPAMWAGLSKDGSLDYQDIETFPIFPCMAMNPDEGGFGVTSRVEGHRWIEFRIDQPGYYGMVRLPEAWALAMADRLSPIKEASRDLYEALVALRSLGDYTTAEEGERVRQQADSALAKARGEEDHQ